MNRRLFGAMMLTGGVGLAFRPARAEPLAFRRGSWQTLRSTHSGHRTIVHFWGLTCGPCLVELPKWGQLHQAHPQADLVMVAADAVPQQPEALTKTLLEAGLQDVESWWFQDRFTERLFWDVSRDWQGELPYTVLLEQDGTAIPQVGVIDDFGAIASWLGGAPFRRT